MSVQELVLVCSGISINAITFALGLIVGASLRVRRLKE
jgi:hypothetical protein